MDEFFLKFENCDKQRYQSNVGAPTQSDFDGSSYFIYYESNIVVLWLQNLYSNEQMKIFLLIVKFLHFQSLKLRHGVRPDNSRGRTHPGMCVHS